MMRLIFILSVLFIGLTARAQTANLRGRLSTHVNTPVPFANVKICNQADSNKCQISVSDSMGNFAFKNLLYGSYTVTVLAISFEPLKIENISIPGTADLSVLILSQMENNLGEVSVSGKRQPIEQKADRTVVNVSGSIASAGSSVYDILERAPGVSTRGGKALTLRGKQGVSVMIDGKPQPISGEDLMAFLKGLPASTVDKIELITSPSAKYDASGNAGIIDIKTKKETKKGYNGNFNANITQGRYGRQSSGFNLNRFVKKWNLQSSYNFQNYKDFNAVNSERLFFESGLPQDSYLQENFFKSHALVHTAQVGIDFYPAKSTQMGFSSRIYTNNNERTLDNINHRVDQTGATIENVQSLGSNKFRRFNPSLNASLRHDLGKGGHVNADIDYGNYQTRTAQNSFSTTIPVNGVMKYNNLKGDLSGMLNLYSAKVDYGTKLNPIFDDLDAGIKMNVIRSRNIIKFAGLYNGIQDAASSSNDFLLKENIFSAYVNGQRKIGKISYQSGLRYEHTLTIADQLTGDKRNTRRYGQLFPNLSIDYTFNKTHNIGLSINRRIDRPVFRQLNPYRYYSNDNTYTVGNPDILPQLTTNYELSYTLMEKYTLRAMYSQIRNNMFTILESDPQVAGTVREIDRNLNLTKYYGLNLSSPYSIGKWYAGFFNLNVFRNDFFGEIGGTNLSSGAFSWSGNTSNNFSLSKSWHAEIIVNYRGRIGTHFNW